MDIRKVGTAGAAALMVAVALLSGARASETYNSRYGEIRINKLPKGAMVTKTPWVGSWWDYTRDGIGYRWTSGSEVEAWQKATDRFADHQTVDPKKLSPAEKLDRMMGRSDKIDVDKLEAYLAKVQELAPDVAAKIEKRQELVRKLNAMIAESSAKPGWKWQDTAEGKEYTALKDEIDQATKTLADLKKDWSIDTALEYEVLHHGNGQFNIGDWWGHCNAWAAAAIMEPEPRKDATVKDVPFTAADVKALLTEAWMEQQSSFFGTRNDWDDDEAARTKVDFQDVTPATFHIFFADQLGNKDRAFIIDRYTGSQVWNQPVNAFRSWLTPLYVNGDDDKPKPEELDVPLTKYSSGGAGKVSSLGKRKVYPVRVKTTFWWITDGLPHDALTRKDIDNSMSDAEFQDWWVVKKRYGDQVHIRTVTYVLWLDKPLDDEAARIIGDGQWEHGDAEEYNHTHPDFIWQPLENINNPGREYENELVDYKALIKDLLPAVIEAKDDPATPPAVYAATDLPLDIADNAPKKPAISKLTVADDQPISALAVKVDIKHTYIGDLRIELEGPGAAGSTLGCEERQSPGCDGCSCQVCVCDKDSFCCGTSWDDLCVKQCKNDCGGCAGNKKVLLKDKGAGGSAKDLSQTWDINEFAGATIKGDWKLIVTDLDKADVGRIEAWSIERK